MKKTLVVGASGLVASRFCELAKEKLDIVAVDEKVVDITDDKSVKNYFLDMNFDAVINFAAYTNVDEAEKEREDEKGIVWKLNVNGPRNLIEVCKEKDIFLVQISTDFVFAGDESLPGPYSESIEPPKSLGKNISWYGWTKRVAEREVLESGVRSAIVRTAYPFRPDNYPLKADWAKKLIILYNEQNLYPLFTDQIYSILYIDDMVIPLAKIVSDELEGIFHIVSRDTTNPYEVAKYLLEKYTGNQVELDKGSIREFLMKDGRTPRPQFGGLQTANTENRLGLRFKTWQEMINEYVKSVVKINNLVY